jgi:hypothetical protein
MNSAAHQHPQRTVARIATFMPVDQQNRTVAQIMLPHNLDHGSEPDGKNELLKNDFKVQV